jgi:hypothetical protein
MKIITNGKLVKRNAAIGKYTSIVALVVLGAGLFITFKYPEKFAYSMACLLIGFILSQVGIYYGNRWGRSPRPDQIINKNLKGMGRENTIYHYYTPASHLLIGPAGIWSLMPYYQGGKVSFDGKRWRTRGGGFTRSYLRIFGQESLGRPEMEAEAVKKNLVAFFTKALPQNFVLPQVNTALIFTDPRVELEIDQAPLPALTPKDLKEFLKKNIRENPLDPEILDMLRKALPQVEGDEE